MIAGLVISGVLFAGLFVYAFIYGASNYSSEVRRVLDDEQMLELVKMMENKR